jgi:Na+-driven multidrug efflux pump
LGISDGLVLADADSGGIAVNGTASRGVLRRFINRWEVDQAVFYSLCLRFWQFLAAPVSVLLIGTFFSPEIQGYYYTFASLVALQSFFELGFHVVIINSSSHEWARLTLDDAGRIRGDPDAVARIISLGRLLFSWYGVLAVLFAVVVGFIGAWFLAEDGGTPIPWAAPWTGLVIASAGLLWTLPFVALLEGCGQIAVVNRYRVFQAATCNLAVWTCILLGGGLWAAVAASAARLAWDLLLLLVRYRRFFADFLRPPAEAGFDWKTELWPMQWRLAVGGLFNYFAFSLFTPVLFHYYGPAVAGQMGMTWQLVMMLQAAALAWVQTRAPLFGRLVAKRDFRELDRVFFRLTWISLLVVVVGAAAIWFGVWGLNFAEFRFAKRVLDPLPTALFVLAIVVCHVPNCATFYLRAHKREMLLPLSVVSSLLIGGTVWWFGSLYGPLGMACAYLVVVSSVVLPWQTSIWRQCRKTHEG